MKQRPSLAFSYIGSVTARHSSSGRAAMMLDILVITFRVSRRPREMYCGHARLCVCVSVCLSAAACLHYYTDPDVTWRSGRGCPLVVHYWADLQSVTGYVAMATLWKCVAEPSGNPPGTPHAARSATYYACRRRLPSPATKSTRLLHAPFHFVYTAGVL